MCEVNLTYYEKPLSKHPNGYLIFNAIVDYYDLVDYENLKRMLVLWKDFVDDSLHAFIRLDESKGFHHLSNNGQINENVVSLAFRMDPRHGVYGCPRECKLGTSLVKIDLYQSIFGFHVEHTVSLGGFGRVCVHSELHTSFDFDLNNRTDR